MGSGMTWPCHDMDVKHQTSSHIFCTHIHTSASSSVQGVFVPELNIQRFITIVVHDASEKRKARNSSFMPFC